jgi:hypothetical protein
MLEWFWNIPALLLSYEWFPPWQIEALGLVVEANDTRRTVADEPFQVPDVSERVAWALVKSFQFSRPLKRRKCLTSTVASGNFHLWLI